MSSQIIENVAADDIDPITFEVLRSVFEFASDRMASVLQRLSLIHI